MLQVEIPHIKVQLVRGFSVVLMPLLPSIMYILSLVRTWLSFNFIYRYSCCDLLCKMVSVPTGASLLKMCTRTQHHMWLEENRQLGGASEL